MAVSTGNFLSIEVYTFTLGKKKSATGVSILDQLCCVGREWWPVYQDRVGRIG